jgi:regulator of sirC expression with transglutaminase-like and TPR domain
MTPREHFERLIALPDGEIPLAEAALWIAAENRPEVRVAQRLEEMDALAEKLRPRFDEADSDHERVRILNEGLFREEGFRGNGEDYSNPENSFLDRVLDTRRGIPITLSILYLEIAGKLGLQAAGIAFPGHFLAKIRVAEEEIIVDPFIGKTLTVEDCRMRLEAGRGKRIVFDSSMLEDSTRLDVLQRVLRNLKLIYLTTRRYEDALACSERMLLIDEDDLIEVRDRGLLYRELERAGHALQDLERYLAAAPDDPRAKSLEEVVESLREQVRRMN